MVVLSHANRQRHTAGQSMEDVEERVHGLGVGEAGRRWWVMYGYTY